MSPAESTEVDTFDAQEARSSRRKKVANSSLWPSFSSLESLRGTIVFGALCIVFSESACAIVSRADFSVPGTEEFERYLGHEYFFGGVGAIRIVLPNSSGVGTCTGTHIGGGAILTAAHCFFDDRTNEPLFSPTNGGAALIKYGVNVSFSGGPNILSAAGIPGRYPEFPTSKATFALPVDTVAIHPGYNSNGFFKTDDIAVARVDPWFFSQFGAKVPVGPPLYSGSSEVNEGSVHFGYAFGYGLWGDGRVGYEPNPALAKRGAMVEMDNVAGLPKIIESKFHDPSEFGRSDLCRLFGAFSPDHPSCFPSQSWTGMVAPGDSGGPLVRISDDNSGGGNNTFEIIGVARKVIGGVVGTEPGQYGSFGSWTKVSPYVSWINQAKSELAAVPGGSGPGLSPDNPINPYSETVVEDSLFRSVLKLLLVWSGQGFSWVDPVAGQVEEIATVGDASFTYVNLSRISFNALRIKERGAEEFRLFASEPDADGWLDLPDNVYAVRLEGTAPGSRSVMGVAFDSDSPIELTWLSVTAVPEPSALHLALVGAIVVAGAVRFRGL